MEPAMILPAQAETNHLSGKSRILHCACA